MSGFFSNMTPESWTALGLLGQGLAQRNFSGGANAALQYLDGQGERKLRQGLLEAQLAETMAQADERKTRNERERKALEAAERKQQALPGLFPRSYSTGQVGSGTFGALPSAGDPMAPAAAGSLDVQRALSAGYTPKEIAELDALRNVGLNKVARTVKGTGPDGREYEYQMDDFGRPVGQPLAQWRAPLQANQGDRLTYLDPYKLSPLSSMPINQSADSRASNALGWANHGLAQKRLAMESSQPKGQIVETPNGFMVVDPREGTSRAVTAPDGSPLRGKGTDRNLTDAQAKANLFGSRMQESDRILRDLEGKYSPMAVNSKMAAAEMPMVGGAAGAVGNLLLTTEGQQAEQAQRDFVNAVLRRESGAVISPAEFANAQKQYFPQPGDDKRTLDQKRRNRQIAIEGLMAEVPEGRRGVPSLTSPTGPSTGGATGYFGDAGNDPLGIRR